MSTTVHDIIEAFREVPTTNRERGDELEKLMVAYLDPALRREVLGCVDVVAVARP